MLCFAALEGFEAWLEALGEVEAACHHHRLTCEQGDQPHCLAEPSYQLFDGKEHQALPVEQLGTLLMVTSRMGGNLRFALQHGLVGGTHSITARLCRMHMPVLGS